MAEKPVGTVSHWFGQISVAGVELTDTLAVGDRVRFLGHTTNFEQEVTSMQIMHQSVSQAGSGHAVGIQVRFRVRPGDAVYRVTS